MTYQQININNDNNLTFVHEKFDENLENKYASF